MEITIQSIHFEASKQLEAFIEKKIKRLARYNDGISAAEVTLKVVKPETNANKDVSIRLTIPGPGFFAQETADTFEEAIDRLVEKLEKQIKKAKEKKKEPGRAAKDVLSENIA